MHIDIPPLVPPHLWPPDATAWTREHRPILPTPDLTTAFAFQRGGESWWSDGAAALAGNCPAGYRRKLTERGLWLDEPSQRLTDRLNRVLDEKGDVWARIWYAPAFRRNRPGNPPALNSIDIFVPVAVDAPTGPRAFNARYIGLALRRFPRCRFYLSEDGEALVVRVGPRLVGIIVSVPSKEDEERLRRPGAPA